MTISNTNTSISSVQLAYPNKTDSTQETAAQETTQQAEPQKKLKSRDEVNFSKDAKTMQAINLAIDAPPSPEREKVVQDIKNEVDNGTYQANSELSAEKMAGSHINERV